MVTIGQVIKHGCNDDWDIDLVAGEERPLIPEGRYTAQCIRCKKGQSHFNSLKLFLTFKILDGEFLETKLFLAINLTDSRTGKPFKKVPLGSKYYKNWTIANYNLRPSRHDRMSPKIFQSGIFEVSVRTVKPKYPDGKTELPYGFHYSVVDFIISRKQ
jgi:hypothetical protein